MRKHKTKLIWGGVIIVAVGLMIWGSSQPASAGTFADTDVACLPGGHQNAITHIHANLSVRLDGEAVTIPSNAGISGGCMAEVHTHDASGEVHIETPGSNPDQTLADFFAVWGEPLERNGYEREIMVNGEPATPEYVFQDGDTIEVTFTDTEDHQTATSSAATTSPPSTTTTNSNS